LQNWEPKKRREHEQERENTRGKKQGKTTYVRGDWLLLHGVTSRPKQQKFGTIWKKKGPAKSQKRGGVKEVGRFSSTTGGYREEVRRDARKILSRKKVKKTKLERHRRAQKIHRKSHTLQGQPQGHGKQVHLKKVIARIEVE